MAASANTVRMGNRTIKVTNLDKVMYPATGTTKGDVIAYYAAIAEWFIPHAARRPVTRKRWVDGVGTEADPKGAFFNKDLNPKSTPDWVETFTIEHKSDDNTYPLINEPATLVWLAQLASLEIHVPQWRVVDGAAQNPDRLVLDLDPGPGTGLPQCVEVAHLIREVLGAMDVRSVPVTSGSKGIHLYASLDGDLTSDDASDLARELAVQMEGRHPKRVVSNMKKELRRGKVLIDWSQNNAAKTTIAPYSLRGRFHPTVAVPRTWDELTPDIANLELDQVIERLAEVGDPLAVLLDDPSAGAPKSVTAALAETQQGPDEPQEGADAQDDRLTTYRSMRDAAKTPEPVPSDTPIPGDGHTFVIQEHHARRLHYDFRLEHDGVLVSWAVPKGPPTDPQKNHLAVQTEDHPLEYGSFEGDIPKGEYGGGKVTIWDSGTYELHKWRDGKEVIVTLTGRADGGLGGEPRKFALIHTKLGGNEKNWLIHLMKPDVPGTKKKPKQDEPATPKDAKHGAVETDEAAEAAAEQKSEQAAHVAEEAAEATADLPELEPMLATASTTANPTGDWHYEVKWDGYRAIAYIADGHASFRSRKGIDLTPRFPELAELGNLLGDHTAVVDGEIVALDAEGRPNFGLLQGDGDRSPAHFMAFDLLHLDGRSLVRDPYLERRAALEELLKKEGAHIHLPTTFGDDRDIALESTRELGLEGVMAKKPDSIYQPGRRAKTWLKIKHRRTQDVVIVGWSPSTARSASAASDTRSIGSLVLAVNDGDALTYAGKVGSGFTEQALAEALEVLESIPADGPAVGDVPAADAKGVQWVEPLLVGEVEYSEWTNSGRLRHAVWRGWRPERHAEQVVREEN